MALRASTSSRLVELPNVNPDDVTVRTKTITTSLQPVTPATVTTTTTTTNKVTGQQQGYDSAPFGGNSSQVYRAVVTGVNGMEGT